MSWLRGRLTKRPFPADPIKGMSAHHRLASETVGYAPDDITQGSQVNILKGGSYTLSIEVAKPKSELEREERGWHTGSM
jgi:hypothetical protein